MFNHNGNSFSRVEFLLYKASWVQKSLLYVYSGALVQSPAIPTYYRKIVKI